ncbi:inner membrane transporter RhtA [Actinocorallia herbida]|uniref:Inner membrane transporter RhtA n=1 Tax=Actinocorallia herbida TaxID=58109 RepID=A0A3N1CU80_9ACTN|nr:EamA family transporter [Actinocorallia herbida]ROO84744.1 inner membrane transporter RhtA [Actinocorallia herbida]
MMRSRAIPAPVLVLAQITSLQLGSAVAKHAYGQVGPLGLAGLRLGFAAMIMWIVVRPRVRRIAARQWRVAIPFGVVIAAMNTAYFQAIGHLPIGVASTLELLGPLALTFVLSRRLEHLASASLALAGVLLLAVPGGALSATGIILGGIAALCRTAYVALSQRVGRLTLDWAGLTVALAVGALILTPIAAVADGRAVLEQPGVIPLGFLVAILSSVVPYALDMTTLRTTELRVFGALLALSPAVGAAVGLVFLGERLTARQLLAVGLIVLAGAWTMRTRHHPPQITPSEGTDHGRDDGDSDPAQRAPADRAGS